MQEGVESAQVKVPRSQKRWEQRKAWVSPVGGGVDAGVACEALQARYHKAFLHPGWSQPQLCPKGILKWSLKTR